MKTLKLPEIKWINVDQIKTNDANPRIIKHKKFKQLVDRMREFPEMITFRPVVLDKNKKPVAGNQRHRAAIELGWKQVPYLDAQSLTPKQLKQFQLWDNDQAGTWDFTELASWDNVFGIEMPASLSKERFTNENCEMPIVPKFDEKYFAVVIVVKSEMDYANLITTLELGREQCYKSKTHLKQSQVLSYERFTELMKTWKK